MSYIIDKLTSRGLELFLLILVLINLGRYVTGYGGVLNLPAGLIALLILVVTVKESYH